MNKKYESPEMEITVFSLNDAELVNVSSGEDGNGVGKGEFGDFTNGIV